MWAILVLAHPEPTLLSQTFEPVSLSVDNSECPHKFQLASLVPSCLVMFQSFPCAISLDPGAVCLFNAQYTSLSTINHTWALLLVAPAVIHLALPCFLADSAPYYAFYSGVHVEVGVSPEQIVLALVWELQVLVWALLQKLIFLQKNMGGTL